MKKTILLFSIVAAVLLASCDNGLTNVDPQVKLINQSTGGIVYFNLVTTNDDGSYNAEGSWVSAKVNQASSNQSISAGTYKVGFDYDSDHSSIQVSSSEYILEDNNSYAAIVYDNNSFVFGTEQ